MFARRANGASLAELILVLVMMAVFGAIAAPRYASSAANYRTDTAARRLAADLELARSTARYTGAPITVTFNGTTHRYDMVGVKDLKHSSTTYTVELAKDPYRAQITAIAAGGDTSVVFDRYGVPDSDFQIDLASGGFEKVVKMKRFDAQIATE